jgi:hypothetical protein
MLVESDQVKIDSLSTLGDKYLSFQLLWDFLLCKYKKNKKTCQI